MIDQDLPGELQDFWRYDRKQLRVHLDGQGKPVTLGRGAFGTVSPVSLFSIHFIGTFSHASPIEVGRPGAIANLKVQQAFRCLLGYGREYCNTWYP